MGNISDKLKEVRLRKGKSQQSVAEYLGITRQAYSHYEVGRRKPDYETLLKLSEFYEISVLDLLNTEKAPASDADRAINDDDIKFALFGDAEIDDELYEEVKAFARFAKERKEKRST